ncbi:MAG: MFS transporter [Acidobacteriota bacterium]|nr:MFS transporter [Acidobacteriota bacterium]
MDSEKPRRRRTIRTFAAASFFNDMGSDMIAPIWPLFVTQILKANMTALGFLDGLGEAVVSLSQAGSGYLSDKWRKRKIFIWTGYLCGALSRFGYAVSAVWTHLIPFRILDRAGKIRGAPRDAVVADISTRADRGRHFGLLRAMDHLGAVCGILLCAFLFNILGFRLLFALAAVPSLAGVFLILRNIQEPAKSDARAFKGLSFRDIGRNLRLYVALNAVFALGAFSYSFLLVLARTSGVGDSKLPFLYLIFAITAAALSWPFGRLADKVGRKPVLFAALALWGCVCVGAITGAGKALIVIPIFILFGAHKAALEPAQKTLAAELAPLDYRASVLGAFQMVIGLSALPASLAAGILWDRIALWAPFSLSLVLTAAAAILLIFVRESPRLPSSESD